MAFHDLSAPVMAYVGMGSNLGDRARFLNGAIQALRQTEGIDSVAMSRIYETEAVGCRDPEPYLNAVAAVETRLDLEAFFARLMAIEQMFERQRPYKNAPRTLDLDLLAFGDAVVDNSHLTVPHPRLSERLFVCVPFEDVAPDWRHPRLNCSLASLLQRLRQQQPNAAEPVVLGPCSASNAILGTAVALSRADR